MTSAARQFAFVFPFPIERCAACQLPLENDVLLVVAITLGFARRVFRLDQAMLRVVAIGDQRLHGIPDVFQIIGGQKLLIIDGDDVLAVVAQKQGAAGTVVETFDAPMDVASNVQAVAIAIADGDQGRAFAVEAEVIERWSLASLRENQLGWIVT